MGKHSRHINIRYFFIKDRHDKKELTIEYCLTDEMIGDFLPNHCKARSSRSLERLLWVWKRKNPLLASRSVLEMHFIYLFYLNIYIYMVKTRTDQFEVKIWRWFLVKRNQGKWIWNHMWKSLLIVFKQSSKVLKSLSQGQLWLLCIVVILAVSV